MKKGMLITFEGLDAAGKDTQTKLAAAYLEKRNLPYRLLSFPTYDGRMSALVQMYLRGEFGSDPKAVNAYAASSFFAMDRYASYMTDWKKDYERGAVLLANRYTTSNAIHQLSKLPEAEWEGFLNWLYDYEYGLLGIPKPDRVLFLRVPPALSFRMAEKRCAETGAAKDIHESDLRHLETSAKAAQYVAERDGWITVDCVAGEVYRTREDIAAELAAYIRELLDA